MALTSHASHVRKAILGVVHLYLHNCSPLFHVYTMIGCGANPENVTAHGKKLDRQCAPMTGHVCNVFSFGPFFLLFNPHFKVKLQTDFLSNFANCGKEITI